MAQPLPSQNMGIPVGRVLRRPMPTARAVMPQQALPQALPVSRPQFAGYPLPRTNSEVRSQVVGGLNNAMTGIRNLFNTVGNRLGVKRPIVAAPAAAMKKGGNVEKLKKLKKPIKRKSLKKADRVKRPAFKEGGAVERFLSKYPDYNPVG